MRFPYLLLIIIAIGCTTGTENNKDLNSNSVINSSESSSSLVEESEFEKLKNYKIDSINLYCFCFSDNDIFNRCNTLIRVTPKSLIKKESLLSSTKDTSLINRFLTSLSSNHLLKDTVDGHDLRLVMTINTKNHGQKTLSYYSESVVCYQDKYLIKYNTPVNNIFRKAFNLNLIKCE